MLGDITPQSIRVTAQAVVYPGRDHVVRVTIEKVAGQRYTQTDLTAVTRAVLVFPETDPVIAYDSLVDPVFTFATGGVLEIDLSDYAMPASIFESHLILFDAEHTGGQVIVDNDDTRLVFDFRNISTTGATPAPTVEFVTEAPVDGELYGRQDGGWVPIDDVVAGVMSVNGQTGVVVLDTDDIPEGTNEYYTDAKASAASPVQTVNGQTGPVVLDADDIAEGATNHYYPQADEDKLAGIEAGAQANVATDIAQGTRTATTVPVTSSTGADATLTAATTSLAGVMTAADKTKLDGIATAATANSSDAALRDRATHTGEQAISTVTGLQTALDGKASAPTTRTISGTSGTLVPADAGNIVLCTSASAVSLSIQLEASGAWPAASVVTIIQLGAGIVTVTDGSGITVHVFSGLTKALRGQYAQAALAREAADTFAMAGLLGGTPA